jgi:hypothetical protein
MTQIDWNGRKRNQRGAHMPPLTPRPSVPGGIAKSFSAIEFGVGFRAVQ